MPDIEAQSASETSGSEPRWRVGLGSLFATRALAKARRGTQCGRLGAAGSNGAGVKSTPSGRNTGRVGTG